MSKRRLGKGIDALLQGRPLDQLENLSSIQQVGIDQLHPNPHQPRTSFNDASLQELADSIRERGIIQPILAEENGDGTFTIIAGERRYRAAKLAGLSDVPIISQTFSEEEKLEIALIENIQREDLNPIDEAQALNSALELSGSTQEELAKRLGKSRSSVANSLRLLRLESDIQDSIASGSISAGHARQIVSMQTEAQRRELLERIVSGNLTVRETETLVRHLNAPAETTGTNPDPIPESENQVSLPPEARLASSPLSVELQKIQQVLIDHFGTRVTIRGSDEKGRIEIPYLSVEDLERIIEIAGARLD